MDTITGNAGIGGTVYAFSIHEYAGVTAAVDALSTTHGNSKALARGSLTTIAPNDLIFAWFTDGRIFRRDLHFPEPGPHEARDGRGWPLTVRYSNCIESGDFVAVTPPNDQCDGNP
jgi:hypothetical protein